ncbi:hypothetical protein [Pseudomonas sp.]|uniref:hypothetical protein n=1 Tax=Pseudomonas sp. TaxID=306 RepID=UPI002730E3C9|nr:hypothetical protein [Pseudomonas sp.]MDP2245442.1 hypothetical protein [Pseudomonas sp.]
MLLPFHHLARLLLFISQLKLYGEYIVKLSTSAFSWMVILIVVAPLTVSAAERGDIIISRDVQPRSATRQPMMPDPNPRVSNPGAVVKYSTTNELSDADFASMSTGMALPERIVHNHLNGNSSLMGAPTHQSVPGINASHGGGGAAGGVAGQVNRGIQQGLRPLQIIGGR